jgi:hypothetical protein
MGIAIEELRQLLDVFMMDATTGYDDFESLQVYDSCSLKYGKCQTSNPTPV